MKVEFSAFPKAFSGNVAAFVAADKQLLASAQSINNAVGGTITRAIDASRFTGGKGQTLDVLAKADSDLSIRELAEETAVSKSAVQRILSSLVETGLAVQDPASRRYGLGPRTLVLGTAYQRRIDLRAVALPHMTHLRDLTGETVGLSVRVGDELLHVEQVESGSALRRSSVLDPG